MGWNGVASGELLGYPSPLTAMDVVSSSSDTCTRGWTIQDVH